MSTVSRIQSAVTNGKASFIHCGDATVRSYLYNITEFTISICIDTIWNWTNRSEQRRTVYSQVTECSVPRRSDGHQLFTCSTTPGSGAYCCDVLNSEKRQTLLVNQKAANTAKNTPQHRMAFGIISFCSTSYCYGSNITSTIITVLYCTVLYCTVHSTLLLLYTVLLLGCFYLPYML